MSDIKNLLDKIQQGAHPVHGDRGMLAALRRGLSEATEQYAWPYLASYCAMTDPKQRVIWLTVAGAAATLAPLGLVRDNEVGVGNMGATLRHLAAGGEHKEKEVDKKLASFENRFRRLLTCQTVEELCRHLVGVVRAAAAKNIPVNLLQLYSDLLAWESRQVPDVRVEWAQGYWVAAPCAEEQP
ncbi:MAG: type I-E CRISPR-associated protein Cse2/CasB [Kiritimatiellae bacterium]|jgi:CRISPR type I-E-associated protein CasB/Cse2|nr:type I-E CRISPR-associated protein Cse2/CasB [Kiritimatiellia bacterium]MDX9794133.1 type I-E CRISPR-associated protein Cse2/CasB [Kiritimatiellia bacterium]